MVKMFYNYKNISDWEIMEVRTVHAFNEDETPIEAIKVLIGEMDMSELHLGWRYKNTTYPIIRWITRGEYERLKEGEGIIVW